MFRRLIVVRVVNNLEESRLLEEVGHGMRAGLAISSASLDRVTPAELCTRLKSQLL